MEFSLAYVKNSSQFILKTFGNSEEESKGKIMNLEELKEKEISGIVFDSELKECPETLAILQEHSKFLPIRSAENTADEFDTMNEENASMLLSKVQHSWVLKNNLVLLENLVETHKHLKELWPNDRTSFFEELWFLIKNNIGATNLRIVFNDLQKAKKEGERNKLIRVIVEGKRIPQPLPGGELADKLMENYEGAFTSTFEVVEYSQAQGELVFLSKINQSPVLFMASVPNLTALQKALLKALFDGLQLTMH